MSCEDTGVDRFLDVKMVMECTHCSQMSVYRRCKSGELPYVKLNGRLLFRKADLEVWFRKNAHGVFPPTAGGAMTMPVSREDVRRDLLVWLDSMYESKMFGAFSIEIKMHEGHVVSVEKMERVQYVKRAAGYERQ